jgi:hypothetical protein
MTVHHEGDPPEVFDERRNGITEEDKTLGVISIVLPICAIEARTIKVLRVTNTIHPDRWRRLRGWQVGLPHGSRQRAGRERHLQCWYNAS